MSENPDEALRIGDKIELKEEEISLIKNPKLQKSLKLDLADLYVKAGYQDNIHYAKKFGEAERLYREIGMEQKAREVARLAENIEDQRDIGYFDNLDNFDLKDHKRLLTLIKTCVYDEGASSLDLTKAAKFAEEMDPSLAVKAYRRVYERNKSFLKDSKGADPGLVALTNAEIAKLAEKLQNLVALPSEKKSKNLVEVVKTPIFLAISIVVIVLISLSSKITGYSILGAESKSGYFAFLFIVFVILWLFLIYKKNKIKS